MAMPIMNVHARGVCPASMELRQRSIVKPGEKSEAGVRRRGIPREQGMGFIICCLALFYVWLQICLGFTSVPESSGVPESRELHAFKAEA